jgi:hypothetical protein
MAGDVPFAATSKNSFHAHFHHFGAAELGTGHVSVSLRIRVEQSAHHFLPSAVCPTGLYREKFRHRGS